MSAGQNAITFEKLRYKKKNLCKPLKPMLYVETIMENARLDIVKQKQENGDSSINLGKITDKASPRDSTSYDLEEKESESHLSRSVDQEM